MKQIRQGRDRMKALVTVELRCFTMAPITRSCQARQQEDEQEDQRLGRHRRQMRQQRRRLGAQRRPPPPPARPPGAAAGSASAVGPAHVAPVPQRRGRRGAEETWPRRRRGGSPPGVPAGEERRGVGCPIRPCSTGGRDQRRQRLLSMGPAAAAGLLIRTSGGAQARGGSGPGREASAGGRARPEGVTVPETPRSLWRAFQALSREPRVYAGGARGRAVGREPLKSMSRTLLLRFRGLGVGRLPESARWAPGDHCRPD